MMKGHKKLWMSIVLSAGLVALTGCGGSDSEYTVAISQFVEHPSLDATRDGFIAALKDAGIEEGKNLKLEYENAQADPTNNLSIAQKLSGESYDLIYAIATPSAQAIVQQEKKDPILFAAVTDPLAAELVDKLDKPSGNVTGASDTNPEAITQLMEYIAANFADVKSVGVVINEGESNAVIMADYAEQALSKHDIKLVKAPVTNTSEVKQAADSLVGKVDAIFITLDNTVVSGVDAIIQVANENDIPFFSSDRDTVEKGAFATVGFKYYDHGYEAGQMAVQILKDGKKPSDLAVTAPTKLDLILNLKAAAEQGIEVTDAMKEAVKDPATNIIE
jgi:putative tryptophan/tyrosine transport system substrate-binding protein